MAVATAALPRGGRSYRAAAAGGLRPYPCTRPLDSGAAADSLEHGFHHPVAADRRERQRLRQLRLGALQDDALEQTARAVQPGLDRLLGNVERLGSLLDAESTYACCMASSASVSSRRIDRTAR